MGQGRVQNPRPGHVVLRRFRSTDAAATHHVFYDAVHQGTSEHYTRRDQLAWAGSPAAPSGWAERLGAQVTHVAEVSGRIVGFMSLTEAGHLDMAFVLPKMMGTGVAARLYAAQESAARDLRLQRLTTDASHLARSFFVKQGWSVLAAQKARTNGHDIDNFAMEKLLAAP